MDRKIVSKIVQFLQKRVLNKFNMFTLLCKTHARLFQIQQVYIYRIIKIKITTGIITNKRKCKAIAIN